VYTVSSFNMTYSDTGLFTVYAGTSPTLLNRFVQETAAEIKKLVNDLSDSEVERVKNQLRIILILSRESSLGRAKYLGKCLTYYDRYVSLNETLEKVMSITRLEIVEVIRSIFAQPLTCAAVGKLGELMPIEEVAGVFTLD